MKFFAESSDEVFCGLQCRTFLTEVVREARIVYLAAMRTHNIVLAIVLCLGFSSSYGPKLWGQGKQTKAKSKKLDFASLVCKNVAGEPTGVVGLTIHDNNQWERTQTAEAAKFFDSVRGPWVVVAGVLSMKNTANTAVAGQLNQDPMGKPPGTMIDGTSMEKGLVLTCTVQ